MSITVQAQGENFTTGKEFPSKSLNEKWKLSYTKIKLLMHSMQLKPHCNSFSDIPLNLNWQLIVCVRQMFLHRFFFFALIYKMKE